MVLCIALVLISLLCYTIWRYRVIKQRLDESNASLIQTMRNEQVNEHHQLLQRIDQSEEVNSQLVQYIREHVHVMRSLIDMSFHLPGDQFVKAFHKQLLMASQNSSFWDCVDFDQLLTEEQQHNIAAIRQQCTTALTDDELLLLKLVAAGFSDLEICVMMGYKNKDYVRVKLSRIKSKAQFDQPLKTYLQPTKA